MIHNVVEIREHDEEMEKRFLGECENFYCDKCKIVYPSCQAGNDDLECPECII